jgi:hypothetical protein
MAIVSIKKALYSDMPKAVEIMLGNFNAVSNMMNSLTGEQNFFEATFFLIKQFLTAQIKAMASDLGANATELLAKQLSAKIAKSLVPGSNIASLALTANELISFGKDAALAPKYVPFTVEYNYDDIKKEHQVIFDEPDSCNFSMFTYLYDVPDEDLAANARRILLDDLIMDNNFPHYPEDGYFVGQDKIILMRTPENGAFFYHDFYIGENIDKTLFESKIRQHPIVKVDIDAHRSQKGMLIDDLNLPRTEMNAKDYIDTVTIDNKDFAVIDFSEMFYDSQNPFYKKVYHALNPMKSDNKTYLKLEGHDIYTLSAIIEFTDFKGHQGGIDGSIFQDTIKVYMPNEVYRNKVSITLINYDNNDDIIKVKLASYGYNTIHTYLFNESALTVECIDNRDYITNSSYTWIQNSSLNAVILIVDDILHQYLQDKYSGNEAKIARALKKIFTNQGTDSYVLIYHPDEIDIKSDTFDFDDFKNLAFEDRFDENGIMNNDEDKYGELIDKECEVVSKSISISKNTTHKIELIATCINDNEIEYIIAESPENGSLSINGHVATYTPNADYLGKDKFFYIAYNGVDYSDPGVITITVLDMVTPDDGLVAYYPYNGNANDESGNGNNGSVNGPKLTIDRFDSINAAYEFDGVDDYIHLSSIDNIAFNNGSVALWFKLSDGFKKGNNTINLFSKDKSTIDKDAIELYFENSSGKLYLDCEDSGGIRSNSDSWDDQWHFVVITWGDSGVQMFIDGTKQNETIQSKFSVGAYPTHIGTHQGEQWFFKGIIDDVYIYDRVISDLEIQALYIKNIDVMDLDNGLIAYYGFENDAKDSSGNSNDGNEYNIQYGSGVAGQSAIFSGKDSYIEIENINGIDQLNSSFSISLFVKTNHNASSNKTYSEIILQKTRISNSKALEFSLSQRKMDNNLSFTVYNDSTNKEGLYSENKPINDNIFHHIVITRNINAHTTIFLDGNPVADKQTTVDNITSNDGKLYIGWSNQDSSEEYFNGAIDDLRIYNRVLSKSEIIMLYMQTHNELNNGLIAHYEFENNAKDSSGNENHGIEKNGISYADGIVGKAAQLDGIDDFIEIIPKNFFNSINDFTISVWTYLTDWKVSNYVRQYIFDGHSQTSDNANGYSYKQGFCIIFDNTGVKEEIHNCIKYSESDSLNLVEEDTEVENLKGNWHQIVYMRKGKTLTTYVDGKSIYSEEAKDDSLNMNHSLFIGAFTGNSMFFKGLIDDLCIYNRALTISEILELFNKTDQIDLNSDLIAHYEFEDNSNDSSGKENNGQEVGEIKYINGLIGKAANFNGVGDYIKTGINRSSFTNISFCTWYKFLGQTTDSWTALLAGNSKDFFIGKNSGDSKIGVQDGNYVNISSTKNAWDTKWHHLCYVLNNLNGSVYLDSTNVGNSDFTGGSGEIYIAHENESTGYYFNGLIDDLRIYNRVISKIEIEKLYNEVPKKFNTAVMFMSESPKDYAYIVDPFIKEWEFKSNQNISGLTVEILNVQGFSNNIIPEITAQNDNGIFKVRVELTPNPDSKPFNRIDLQFKDLSNQTVKVGSSEKFWSIVRTNRIPELDPGESLQLVGESGSILQKKILAIDKDDDPLQFSVIGDVGTNATFEANNINVQFNSDGVYTIQLKIFDGTEYIIKNLYVLTYGENGGIKEFYSDVSIDHQYYEEIMFATLMGAVWGDTDPTDNSKRLFNPEKYVNWAEALKMVLKSSAIRGLIELPTSNYLQPDNYEKDWYWAKPYYTFARKKKAVSNGIKFSDLPTREEIGKLIVVSLDLIIPKEFSNFDLSFLVFSDKEKFSENYLQYATTARLFNLFFTTNEANPGENVKRDDLAMVISKILRMPTGEIDSEITVEYGDNFIIHGIKNLNAAKILNLGNGVIKNEWIESPEDYIKTSIVVNRDLIINEKLINGISPVNVSTKGYELGQNHIIAIIQNTDGGARNILTKEFNITFIDSDFDGIQDREDLWPDDSRYSSDINNNGIPDILDIIYALDHLTVNESLSLSQTEIPIAKIIEDGKIDYGETDCPRLTTWARNQSTGECKAFLTPCDIINGWIIDKECFSPVDFNRNNDIDLSDLIIALKILSGMEQENIQIQINERIELEDLILILNSF